MAAEIAMLLRIHAPASSWVLAHQGQEIAALNELPDERRAGIPQAGRIHALCALAKLRCHKRRTGKPDASGVSIKFVMDEEAEPFDSAQPSEG